MFLLAELSDYWTISVFESVAVAPSLSVMVAVMVSVPGLLNMKLMLAPAPICPDPATPPDGQDAASCQVVEAPPGDGRRLVHETEEPPTRVPDAPALGARADEDGEIRLTYRQLSALIEDAIRSLQ